MAVSRWRGGECRIECRRGRESQNSGKSGLWIVTFPSLDSIGGPRGALEVFRVSVLEGWPGPFEGVDHEAVDIRVFNCPRCVFDEVERLILPRVNDLLGVAGYRDVGIVRH